MGSVKKQVRSVDIKVKVFGDGTLNYDDAELSIREDRRLGILMFSKGQNVKAAKKTYTLEDIKRAREGGGEVIPRAVVSAASARHYIFQDGSGLQSSAIFLDGEIFVGSVASSFGLLRGWQRSVKGENTKRKSPLTVTRMKQVDGDVMRREVSTASGIRSETSYTLRDVVGEANYEFKVSLDVGELPFVSTDIMFDRQGILSDDFHLFAEMVKARMGYELPSPVQHAKLTSSVLLGEAGFMLPEPLVRFLVKDVVRRILGLEIRRADAYGIVEEIQIKLVGIGEQAMAFRDGVVIRPGDGDEAIDRLLEDVEFVTNYEVLKDTKIASFSERYREAYEAAKKKKQIDAGEGVGKKRGRKKAEREETPADEAPADEVQAEGKKED